MEKRLTGRSAIVIGSTRGIGRAIARIFAAEGARVLVVGRNEEGGTQTVTEIEQRGGEASFFRADVSEFPAMEGMVQAAIDRYGRIDVLCNNAGIVSMNRIEDMSREEWEQAQAVNLTGTFLAVKACLPQMKRQQYGRIVLTSSITGPITAFPGCAHYAASKAGMLGFMRTAAIESARHNITVNAVLPGTIMTENLSPEGDFARQAVQGIPMGKLGDPDDVGYAVLFLASNEAKYITGQTLIVDGGQVLPESLSAVS